MTSWSWNSLRAIPSSRLHRRLCILGMYDPLRRGPAGNRNIPPRAATGETQRFMLTELSGQVWMRPDRTTMSRTGMSGYCNHPRHLITNSTYASTFGMGKNVHLRQRAAAVRHCSGSSPGLRGWVLLEERKTYNRSPTPVQLSH